MSSPSGLAFGSLVFSLFLYCDAGAHSGSFSFIPLNTDGDHLVSPAAINSHDQVVGYTIDTQGAYAGFVWSTGVLTLVSGASSFGAVNDGGIAAGAPAGKVLDYVTYNIANGALTDVPVPFAKNNSEVSSDGINKSGVVVGAVTASHDRNVVGFISVGGNSVSLLPPSEKQSLPLAVNKSGTVLVRCGYIYYNPYVYHKNSFVQFAVPGASVTAPAFLTDNGVVGGYAVISGVSVGFTMNGSVYTTYDAPNAPYTTVTGIGPTGQIYGSFEDSAGIIHGFVNVNVCFIRSMYPILHPPLLRAWVRQGQFLVFTPIAKGLTDTSENVPKRTFAPSSCGGRFIGGTATTTGLGFN